MSSRHTATPANRISRRRFIAGALALTTLPAFARSDGVDLKQFGAKGDGTTDDSAAFRDALRAAVSANQTLNVPAGRYRITSVPLDAAQGAWSGQSVRIRGDGSAASVFIGAPTSTENQQPVSGPVLRVHGAKAVAITDIGFDGGVPEVRAPLTENLQTPPSSLVEIRDCGHVVLARVSTTRNMHRRSNRDIEAASFGYSGPVFLFRCSNVEVDSCSSIYPAFRQGWWLVNCTNVTVAGFVHQGPAEFDRFATSTPLNILGPETENVRLSKCRIVNATGSSVNLGGRGRFYIGDSEFQGYVDAASLTPEDPSLNPGDHGFGKGVDLGSEHQEDLYPGHPPMQSVRIENCTFTSLFSYSLKLSKRDWCPASDIAITGNHIDQGHRGIELSACHQVAISGNSLSQIFRPVPKGGRLGQTMTVSRCSNVDIDNNTFDGTYDAVPNSGKRFSRTPETGLFVDASSKINIINNNFLGFRRAQISVRPRTGFLPDDVTIRNNVFRRGQNPRAALGSIVSSDRVKGNPPGVTIGTNEFGPLDGPLSDHFGAYSTE